MMEARRRTSNLKLGGGKLAGGPMTDPRKTMGRQHGGGGLQNRLELPSRSVGRCGWDKEGKESGTCKFLKVGNRVA